MIKVSRTYTRANVNVPFHHDVIDGEYFYNAFDLTSKRTSHEAIISSDNLSCTYVSNWIDLATWEAHKEDPQVLAFFAARDQYNSANGITYSDTIIEDL